MPTNAGQIVIPITAGTSKFILDMEAAKGKVREFGASAVSDHKAAAAAMKLVEGQFLNNKRAADSFLASIPGVGEALKAAFPIVGAVALIGVLSEVGVKAHDFLKQISDAPQKISGMFRELNGGLAVSNDQLKVANDRLANDIAKLEGRRQNTIALALDEAKLAADKLTESLERSLGALDKLLREQAGGAAHSFFAQMLGEGSTRDIAKEIGGETGYGGFRGNIASLSGGQRQAAFATEIKRFQDQLAQAEQYQQSHSVNGGLNGKGPLGGFQGGGSIMGDLTARIELLKGTIRDLSQESAGIDLQTTNTALTKRKDALTADESNSKADRPLENKLKSLDAQLDGIKAKLATIGGSESSQVLAKAFGESQKAIEEVNKSLEKYHRSLSTTEQDQIRHREVAIASNEAEEAWRSKLEASTTSIDARIQAQEALSAAIGKGYDATRAASVQTRLMQELGQHANDSEWMSDHAGDVSGLKSRFGAEFDSQHGAQTTEALQKLSEQTSLERDLAAVQSQGAEAVRQAGLAHKLAAIARDNDADSARKLMAAEIELYKEERANVSADEISKLNQKIEATNRLASATLKGADAIRQANLESRLEESRRNGGGFGGAAGAIGEDQAQHNLELAQAAARTNRLQSISDEIAKLQEAKQLYGDTLSIDIAIRDLENQKLHALVDQTLALGGARNGLKAFFQEMQADAATASQKIARDLYDALKGVSDGIADVLAKGLTGAHKKGQFGAEFGKMFQSVGDTAVKGSLQTGIHAGLGQLGKLIPGLDKFTKAGLPLGSPGNPSHVIIDNPGGFGGGGGNSIGGSLASGGSSGGGGGIFGGLFGGGSQGGGIFSFGGGMATGGDVDPGHFYEVEEEGHEFFKPGVSGRVNKGGGGDTHYHVDARGAQIGAENRIARMLESVHSSAITNAGKANMERSRRVPRSS